jgi:flagellar motor switch/type III secretory pathway protein FliN
MAEGDVLWPDVLHVPGMDETLAFGNNGYKFAVKANGPCEFTLGERMNDMDNTGTKRVDASYPQGVGQMHVDLQIEVARVKMPLHEVAGLVPGQVLKLDAPMNDKVQLLAGDTLVATGQLVKAGDDVAVEILEVYNES